MASEQKPVRQAERTQEGAQQQAGQHIPSPRKDEDIPMPRQQQGEIRFTDWASI